MRTSNRLAGCRWCRGSRKGTHDRVFALSRTGKIDPRRIIPSASRRQCHAASTIQLAISSVNKPWNTITAASQRTRLPAHQQIPLHMQEIRFPVVIASRPRAIPRFKKNPPPDGARKRKQPMKKEKLTTRMEAIPNEVVMAFLKDHSLPLFGAGRVG